MIVRGARQVGKTSFVVNTLKELKDYPQVMVNLAAKGTTHIDGIDYFGRDFFGTSEDALQFFHNLELMTQRTGSGLPTIVFIDEADRHPISLEAIQFIAARSDEFKVIYTGSNLENIAVKNAATGRKRFLDLYPITFGEFLAAYAKDQELGYMNQVALQEKIYSDMYHMELLGLFDLYLRLGGMPRVLDAFLDRKPDTQPIPELMSNLVSTIEENVKTVLGSKTSLYEYEDILRKIAVLSTETLKFSRLQVQHAGRAEAKKLVNKTVGARVAHKIRLYDLGEDLSKYIIFDSGIANYLLAGSNILNNKITETHMATLYETVVGDEIIASLPSRDDLFYWKSKRGAQVEFMLKSPFAAIDVKSSKGDTRSLDSCALFEKELSSIVKVSKQTPRIDVNHIAKISSLNYARKVPLVIIPHYLSGRILELLKSHGL